MFAIFKKELRSYFINAIGYVFAGVFLAVTAVLCCVTTLHSKSYSTSSYFTAVLFLLIVIVPLLTMKLFAEEKKLRTEQMLLTAPVSIGGMIMGKFLAALTMFGGGVLLSCVNFIPLFIYGSKERDGVPYSEMHVGPVSAEIISCTIGIILIGAAFIAIGMFVSSLTENQLAAAVVTVTIIFVMLAMDMLNSYIDAYAIRFVLSWFSIFTRFADFTDGIFSFSSVLYFLSISGVFLFLTARIYDKRRWG
jgi:ABC-2 type transport system permease protein